ncbi:hypothetical protein ACWGI0_05735 [Streptomyces sp. NPDC054802]
MIRTATFAGLVQVRLFFDDAEPHVEGVEGAGAAGPTTQHHTSAAVTRSALAEWFPDA